MAVNTYLFFNHVHGVGDVVDARFIRYSHTLSLHGLVLIKSLYQLIFLSLRKIVECFLRVFNHLPQHFSPPPAL
jgi:hypothetical protein